ncbi:MAG: hypothetical protein AAGJ70_05310 [Pseudomonadota bacterium]
MMKKLMMGVAAAATFLASPAVAEAQTIKVLVAQEDWDKHSVERNNRIQRAVLNTWNSTLNAPAVLRQMKQYGIDGLDVYDETAVTLNFYKQDRTRRRDEELISIARQIKNPRIDVVVLYTLYARAVTEPYTKLTKLLTSMSYRAIDTRSGRFFGGDNIDIDPDGVIMTGCATSRNGVKADVHCVKEFVSRNGERLARDAGNAMALRLAALLGQQYGSPDAAATNDKLGDADGYEGEDSGVKVASTGGRRCNNIPTTFILDYQGFTPRQKSLIEANMSNWRCGLDLDAAATGNSLSNAAYEYKTRLNEGQLIRQVRLMAELMGVVAEIRNQGRNTIQVRAIGLRTN